MELLLMGPLEVHTDGFNLRPGPPQQSHVLAVLAVEAGRIVPTDDLIDRVWDEAPSAARRTLHVYVSRIRRLINEAGDTAPRVIRRSMGYQLQVPPEAIDAHRFRRLIAEGDQCHNPTDRAALLHSALKLWRGTPLAGLPGAWAQRVRRSWHQQYLDALLDWAQAEIDRGNHRAVIAPLIEITGEYPLEEPLTAALIQALAVNGRTAEALHCYHRIRRHLADDLGADPGRDLQRIHRAVLHDT